MAKIIEDVERLAGNGVREITLIGQNVNAYHGDGPDGQPWPFGKLLYRLAEIPGIVRLRYSTSHPRDVEDSLIDAHRDLDALMPFVHLPVQCRWRSRATAGRAPPTPEARRRPAPPPFPQCWLYPARPSE